MCNGDFRYKHFPFKIPYCLGHGMKTCSDINVDLKRFINVNVIKLNVKTMRWQTFLLELPHIWRHYFIFLYVSNILKSF